MPCTSEIGLGSRCNQTQFFWKHGRCIWNHHFYMFDLFASLLEIHATYSSTGSWKQFAIMFCLLFLAMFPCADLGTFRCAFVWNYCKCNFCCCDLVCACVLNNFFLFLCNLLTQKFIFLHFLWPNQWITAEISHMQKFHTVWVFVMIECVPSVQNSSLNGACWRCCLMDPFGHESNCVKIMCNDVFVRQIGHIFSLWLEF